jgi:excisionase family DNA binding protein
MTTREAAAYVRMSYRTLEDLRTTGGGPVYSRPSRNMVRYHRDDLDAWMSDRKFRFTSQEVAKGPAR